MREDSGIGDGWRILIEPSRKSITRHRLETATGDDLADGWGAA